MNSPGKAASVTLDSMGDGLSVAKIYCQTPRRGSPGLAEHCLPLSKAQYNQCVTKGQAKRAEKTVGYEACGSDKNKV